MFWLVVGWLVHGLGGFEEHWRFLVSSENPGLGSDVRKMYGLLTWIILGEERLGVEVDQWVGWLVNGVVYGLLWLGFGWWSKGRGLEDGFAVALVAATWLAGHVWSHDLAMWLVPMVLWWKRYEQTRRRRYLVGMVVTWLYPFGV